MSDDFRVWTRGPARSLAEQIAEYDAGTVQRSKALLCSSLEAGGFAESREIELQAAIDIRHALKAAEASRKADDVRQRFQGVPRRHAGERLPPMRRDRAGPGARRLAPVGPVMGTAS